MLVPERFVLFFFISNTSKYTLFLLLIQKESIYFVFIRHFIVAETNESLQGGDALTVSILFICMTPLLWSKTRYCSGFGFMEEVFWIFFFLYTNSM